jgi:hypothetical protein
VSTFLFVRGMEPIEVEESYNLVRQRLNEVVTGTNRDGTEDDSKRPLHKVSFKTVEGGRVAIVAEYLIGVGSDVQKDEDE